MIVGAVIHERQTAGIPSYINECEHEIQIALHVGVAAGMSSGSVDQSFKPQLFFWSIWKSTAAQRSINLGVSVLSEIQHGRRLAASLLPAESNQAGARSARPAL